MRSPPAASRVAIIGSFRQHFREIADARSQFVRAGLVVTSPQGKDILEPGIDFVRFESDPKDWNDPTVQTVALHRILRSDFVFVVAPKGYVGKTTCFEIGRVIQASRPIYFSEAPKDLPIFVSQDHIVAASRVCAQFEAGMWQPRQLNSELKSNLAVLEADLISGRYRDDEYIAANV